MVIQDLLNYIAPLRCVNCQKQDEILCKSCSIKISKSTLQCFLCSKVCANGCCDQCARKYKIDKILTPYTYDDIAKKIIYATKFGRSKQAAIAIGRILSENYKDEIRDCQYVSYIPTVKQRIRQRGYDQCRVIAKTVAKSHNITFLDALSRLDKGQSKGMSRDDRQQEKQRYRLRKNIPRGQILLIDDIITTGNTVKTAAGYLKGADNIVVMAFAKVELD